MSPEDAAKKKALNDQLAALNAEKPKPLPMASIVTDGDWRSASLGYGDYNEDACPKCEQEYVGAGKFLELGPGKANYKVPAIVLPLARRSGQQGISDETRFYQRDHARKSAHRASARGRADIRAPAGTGGMADLTRQSAAREGHRQSHLGDHFGKGIVPTVDNFGKMGEQPTNQQLLDWLAVDFMDKGWSIKQMQRLIMTSEAYQMASEYNDAASAKNDPEDTYLWRYRIQRLEGEIIRDNIMSVAGSIDLTMGGPAIFPHVDESFIKTLFRGI